MLSIIIIILWVKKEIPKKETTINPGKGKNRNESDIMLYMRCDFGGPFLHHWKKKNEFRSIDFIVNM